MEVSSPLDWLWWYVYFTVIIQIVKLPHISLGVYRVLFVITARLGSATVRSALVSMVVCVRYKRLFVLNARDLYGITEEGYFSALSALVTSVKMTSLNIRHLVRSWKLKPTNASRATDTANTLA